MARLIDSLTVLRGQLDALAPDRDKSSDGWIGDLAHQATPSDHNPDSRGLVHAIDVDETGPWPDGFTLMRAVRQIVTDHRAGRETRLTYVIYERTIWSASWGWAPRTYTGANPHDHHAHFSASYDTARERDTRPWNLGHQPPAAAQEDDVSKTDVIDALDDPTPWVSPGVRNLARQKGWGDTVSTRALLEYMFAEVALNGPDRWAAIAAAVGNVDEEVMAKLGAAQTSAEQKASLLRPVLGDQAAAVGRLLAGLT